MVKKILVVGAGAIGGFYGALLAKAGADVAVVCRSDYDTVKLNGFTIHSQDLGTWRFAPAGVFRHASEFREEADCLLLCTKVIPNLDRAALIREAVSPKTAIVLIQNGVDIEREIQEAFPDNELISGLAFICCNRIGPGRLAHLAYGRLTLGSVNGPVSTKTRELNDLFGRAGIECLASADVVTERWKKCVWNAPFNPLSVLSGGLPTSAILASQEPFVRHIMEDVCRIAAALGHPLPERIVDNHIDSTRTMPAYKTSMLIDYEQGRPLETEAILGNALRAGRRAGVAAPYLESIYALMKLRELQRALS
ncbi:ketopantoate reductase family protein [Methylosarcina fibrata]|uniref:ketopantoate reductase family protein n=1 Tax=Methylosarcina fibrata TaxID=105972 RepID=UPI000360162E|nr:2-dehydropantoate 2-reductase [Methylosarcina fibrata]